MEKLPLLLLFSLPLLTLTSSETTTTFNVLHYGAIGDGRNDDTNAFVRAWEATCTSSMGSSTMEVPSGKTFLINPLDLNGPCNNQDVNVEIHGNILAPSDDPLEWRCDLHACNNWIHFRYVNNLTVHGTGMINGRGRTWWTERAHDSRPTALQISLSNNVVLSGLTFKDNPHVHVALFALTSVRVSNLTIDSPGDSPNTDGIHISRSTNVSIDHCHIATGDDCISIVRKATDLKISNITCGPGHGISIGSLGKNGAHDFVENVKVRDIVFRGTRYGARIKTWQGGNGYVRNVIYERILTQDSLRVIDIDQFYCDGIHCGIQDSALQISNITFRQILGTSDNPAVNLACSKSFPCRDIVLDDIYILPTHTHRVPVECSSAHGRVQGMNVPHVSCLNKS